MSIKAYDADGQESLEFLSSKNFEKKSIGLQKVNKIDIHPLTNKAPQKISRKFLVYEDNNSDDSEAEDQSIVKPNSL